VHCDSVLYAPVCSEGYWSTLVPGTVTVVVVDRSLVDASAPRCHMSISHAVIRQPASAYCMSPQSRLVSKRAGRRLDLRA